jgi:ATP-binding cassette subfamily B protein
MIDSMDTTTVTATDLYRALWAHARGARGAVVAATGLLLGSQLVKLATPWLAAQAINTLQIGGVSAFGTAAQWIGAIFLATVLSWALHGPGRIIERNVALRVRERLTDRLVRKLLGAPLEWHESRHSGETLHRVERSSGALYDFAQSQFMYLQSAVSLVGPLVALMWLSPPTGAAAIVGFGLILWGVVGFDRSMMRLATDENAANRRLQAAQVDALGNIVSVFALRLQAATRERLRERLARTFEPLRRMILLNEAKWCTVDVLGTALWCALLVLYVWSAHRDAQALGAPLLLGGLFMVHQYAQQASGVVTSIASNYQGFARHRADYASAAPILEAPSSGALPDDPDDPDAPHAPHAPHAPLGPLGPHGPYEPHDPHEPARSGQPGAVASPPQAPPPSSDWRSITVSGLQFVHAAHRGTGRATLADLDLQLRRGLRIALVGASGSGKSSLMRVLAGLYAADAVHITVDGRPASAIELNGLATLIPQDAEVFEGTLRENLELAGQVSAQELQRILHVACLDDWLATLPDGLESRIAERGGNLSGGQRQRIALARALVAARDSSILLLDEVTSSLDPATEAAVFDRLLEARANACVIASVHRLHLLPRFDQVIRLDAGRIGDGRAGQAPVTGP